MSTTKDTRRMIFQLLHAFVIIVVLPVGVHGAHGDIDVGMINGCSWHKTRSCHPDAECEDINTEQNLWQCKCPPGMEGDGYIHNGVENSGCGKKTTCSFDSECHSLGFCNGYARCECKQGYKGDGFNQCEDIDECDDRTAGCHHHADCHNTQGSFKCVCQEYEEYFGNGTVCFHKCQMDDDCGHTSLQCVQQMCICKDGFELDVHNGVCMDLDECMNDPCHEYASCTNEIGAYTCKCLNGYEGDGTAKCERVPTTCQEVLDYNPRRRRSGMYVIDPDGPGPLEKVEVYCEMRSNRGITTFFAMRSSYFVRRNKNMFKINYRNTIPDIKAVIANSKFCYQSIRFRGRNNAALLNGDDYWIDVNDNKQYSWGGSLVPNTCTCGALGHCNNRASPCNCDGSSSSCQDGGKIIQKELLPLMAANVNPSPGYGSISIGPLKCGNESFDLPRTCHEAKFDPYLKIRKDGPQVLDFDGPDGMYPILAFCDMESHEHVGITEIPHNIKYERSVSGTGEISIEYVMDSARMKGLLNISPFCMQTVSYTCTNSRLLHGEVTFSDIWGNEKDYWPGGMQVSGKCGCGLLGVCEDNHTYDFIRGQTGDLQGCRCDVIDGKERKDIGAVYHNEDLPIGAININTWLPDSAAQYEIGPLRCSNMEFGIPATCQQYAEEGLEDTYALPIDPDGPMDPENPGDNQPWFLVECVMHAPLPYATTVVHYEREYTAAGIFYYYKMASVAQLTLLTERSVYCSQKVDYKCTSLPLHSNDYSSSYMPWNSRDGVLRSYYAGDGSKPFACACALESPPSCSSGLNCNCDEGDAVAREDLGFLSNKKDLPIMNFIFKTPSHFHGKADMDVGPLECTELYRNCGKKKFFNERERLPSEPRMHTGYFVIDPDGAFGLDPFLVQCLGTKTVVEAYQDDDTELVGSSGKGVSKCYNVNYKSNGYNVSAEQVMALVASSPFCGQELTDSCLNAPLSGYSNFTTCDGKAQTGWAGSMGYDMCACGITGKCYQESEVCNCDTEDGEWHKDGDWIQQKNRLAICQFCRDLDPASGSPSSSQGRSTEPSVSDLFCDIGGISGAKTCQDFRNWGVVDSGTQMIQPNDDIQPFPVYCNMFSWPPYGVMEVYPKVSEIVIHAGEAIDVVLEYFSFSFDTVKAVVGVANYCTQELYIRCQNSGLHLGGVNGWYSVDGKVQNSWAGNKRGLTGCAGIDCNCNSGGSKIDGGLITDTELLPVTRVRLGAESGTRTLVFGPLKCYNLYRTCHEIKLAKQIKNPMRNNTYAIDSDLGGGNDPFAVHCDFTSDRKIGITKIDVDLGWGEFEGKKSPRSHTEEIRYKSGNYDQINSLAQVSKFCLQHIQFHCLKTPLMLDGTAPFGHHSVYGGVWSTSFGAVGNSTVPGCACAATGSCPEGSLCHCDGKGALKADIGFLTNRAVIPIQGVQFGGQSQPGASASYSVTPIWCAPRPVFLPKDCHEAHKRGFRTGDILIQPSRDVEPFLVHCLMDKLVPDGGVTVVNSHHRDGEEMQFKSNVTLSYFEASYKQLRSLVEESKFCQQPFKFTCRNTQHLSTEAVFAWRGGAMQSLDWTYVGAGEWFAHECSCGVDGLCGGSEPREVLMNMSPARKCNCDAGDGELRADAGIFSYKAVLPMLSVRLGDDGLPDSYGHITVGSLYCADKDFDLDECALGFHDCHEHAKCINKVGSFECLCKVGYRGLGRPNGLWANGRNCEDDDECALWMCGDRATCTNLPGDYSCTCKEGYTQINAHTCDDIDECTEGTHNCSDNAECINYVGGFGCRCNPNFRGDGYTCHALGTCMCFGDPHCMTMDGVHVYYQGECQYVMSRDQCNDLDAEPTFQLLSTFSPRGNVRHATWVKEVQFHVHGYVIDLKQNRKVWVDGSQVYLPFRRDDVIIRMHGNNIEVYTQIGLDVTWDGKETVQLHTSARWSGELCGLCGNYNNVTEDDLIVGPACPDNAGEVTENHNVFGDSWVNPDYKANNPQCKANCSDDDDEEECDENTLEMAEQHCEALFSVNHPSLMYCNRIIDEQRRIGLLESCIYDMCHSGEDPAVVICTYTKHLIDACIDCNAGMAFINYEDFCPFICAENEEVRDCGNTSQVTCYDLLTNTPPQIEESLCQRGCYCKDGFVLDNDKCVAEEQCGCLDNGDYYEVGANIDKPGCDRVATCQENNVWDTEDQLCHEDATCKLEDGRYGCHCDPGMFGDGINFCITDPCLNDPCGEDETCLRDPERNEGYICICAEGFEGDCNNCTDINECNVYGPKMCPHHSECINTVGSYRCECWQGFYLYGGKCVDRDECALAKKNGAELCPDNSRCLNKFGSFECICCTGFKKDSFGSCVESSETTTGARCCICNMDVCDRPGKICGEDFKQYDNYRDMVISRCERGIPPRFTHAVDYEGPCKSNCQGVQCPRHQECKMVNVDGTYKPSCLCSHHCTEANRTSGQVCSNKLDLYTSRCHFYQAQCELDREAFMLPDINQCMANIGQLPVSGWSSWGPCSVSCGLGVSVRTRHAYRPLSPAELDQFPLTRETECYRDPCPGSACDTKNCNQIFSACVERAPGAAVCECPACTNIDHDPVCGFTWKTLYGGIEQRLHYSECHLHQYACLRNVSGADVISHGRCGLDPLNCTRVPKAHPITVDGFTSVKNVYGYTCEGGCGSVKQDCCRPAATMTKDVPMYNDLDGGVEMKQVEIVTECECQDEDQDEDDGHTDDMY